MRRPRHEFLLTKVCLIILSLLVVSVLRVRSLFEEKASSPTVAKASVVQAAVETTRPSSQPAPGDKRFVGAWTLDGGDYPLTYLFTEDGRIVPYIYFRKTEASTFNTDGDQLIFNVKQTNGSITRQNSRFALTKTALTLFDDDGSKRIFVKDDSFGR